MAALSILNVVLHAALNETPRTSVLRDFCKRVRLRKSNCRKCVEVCPENAISLDPGPTLNGGCSGCGLCERVCPTEVFQSQIYKDTVLLTRAKSFPQKKRLVIHCHRGEGERNGSISIACLGSVSENLLLGAALLGFEELLLIQGVCAKCRFQKGRKLLADSIMTSRALLESLELGKFPIHLTEQEKGREKILSRREIFSKLCNEARRKTSSCLCNQEEVFQKQLGAIPGRKDGKRDSPRRRLLQKLIKQKGWGNPLVLEYRPEFPWGKIKIDGKNCSACGTCLTLCPTGSISGKWEDGYQLYYVNSSLCTNCSLCKEACPRKAIDFEVQFPLTDILEDEGKVTARVKLTPCMVCGEMVTAEKRNLCFTCEKRQVGPIPASL